LGASFVAAIAAPRPAAPDGISVAMFSAAMSVSSAGDFTVSQIAVPALPSTPSAWSIFSDRSSFICLSASLWPSCQ